MESIEPGQAAKGAAPEPLAELARRSGVSESSLIRAYKNAFGITPAQHLLSMRVDFARHLLARGMAPADAAAKAGFSDQAHLKRTFRQRIGATPGAYRAMVAGKAAGSGRGVGDGQGSPGSGQAVTTSQGAPGYDRGGAR